MAKIKVHANELKDQESGNIKIHANELMDHISGKIRIQAYGLTDHQIGRSGKIEIRAYEDLSKSRHRKLTRKCSPSRGKPKASIQVMEKSKQF